MIKFSIFINQVTTRRRCKKRSWSLSLISTLKPSQIINRFNFMGFAYWFQRLPLCRDAGPAAVSEPWRPRTHPRRSQSTRAWPYPRVAVSTSNQLRIYLNSKFLTRHIAPTVLQFLCNEVFERVVLHMPTRDNHAARFRPSRRVHGLVKGIELLRGVFLHQLVESDSPVVVRVESVEYFLDHHYFLERETWLHVLLEQEELAFRVALHGFRASHLTIINRSALCSLLAPLLLPPRFRPSLYHLLWLPYFTLHPLLASSLLFTTPRAFIPASSLTL